ncbi:phosphoethanolamine transferase [Pedobacter cryophilus]|uniref:Phosphoethanolamine transferase n=1 Tax=Pedobacter cryophilus TaxID=2571271 RepID=A0A4U1BYM7_9SPHI|nr:phosphoethanolamine transferase [Pedobacter cryophilus]TKB96773.1 phosphoethanolamine transferase [Pedobacter cryophilus]
MNAHITLPLNQPKSKTKSKLWFNVSLVLTIVFLLSIAPVIGSLITGKYIQLLLAFLITTCFILAPVALFRNYIKLYTWLFLPIIVFVPISLFCVILYKLPLNLDIMVVIYNTNTAEALEFANGYILYFIALLIGYYWAYIYLTKKLPSKISWNNSLKISLGAILTFVLITLLIAQDITFKNQFKKNLTASFPGSLIYNSYLFRKQLNLINQHEEQVKDFKFNASQNVSLAKKQIYVLVIGESARAKNWQIFGYERENSPELTKKQNELIKFSNTVSGGYITALAVPMLITRASADDYDRVYTEKSIITAYKEAGFKTYWLSNQNDFEKIGMFARESDEEFYLPSNYTFGKNVNLDMELIPYLQNILSKNEEKVFIILHTLGSHYNYAARYPNAYDKFKPSLKTEKVNPTDDAKKEIIINSYDNTILYTDAVISKMIDLIKATQAVSTLTYVSDHGEDMFDDERKLSQHIEPVPSEYVASIPFFMWSSTTYQTSFKDKINNLNTNKDKPVGSQNIFYTQLDLSSIQYPNMDRSKSLASKTFESSPQRILGGDSKVYNYNDLKK